MRLFSERFVGNLFTATPCWLSFPSPDQTLKSFSCLLTFFSTVQPQRVVFIFLLLSNSFLFSPAFFRHLLQSYPTADVNWLLLFWVTLLFFQVFHVALTRFNSSTFCFEEFSLKLLANRCREKKKTNQAAGVVLLINQQTSNPRDLNNIFSLCLLFTAFQMMYMKRKAFLS